MLRGFPTKKTTKIDYATNVFFRSGVSSHSTPCSGFQLDQLSLRHAYQKTRRCRSSSEIQREVHNFSHQYQKNSFTCWALFGLWVSGGPTTQHLFCSNPARATNHCLKTGNMRIHCLDSYSWTKQLEKRHTSPAFPLSSANSEPPSGGRDLVLKALGGV